MRERSGESGAVDTVVTQCGFVRNEGIVVVLIISCWQRNASERRERVPCRWR